MYVLGDKPAGGMVTWSSLAFDLWQGELSDFPPVLGLCVPGKRDRIGQLTD